jgi:hypothetical protein
MDYAAESFDGPVLFGDRNPNPTHFQHIAAYMEMKRLALKRKEAQKLADKMAAERRVERRTGGRYLHSVK